MKNILIKKNQKKIKILTHQNKIIISGPLGTISHLLKFNIFETHLNSVFIKKKELNFFIQKIKAMIISVTKGWFLELILNGVGYKCFKENDKKSITFDLGYSALINYLPYKKLKIKIFKNKIILFSLEREYLNNVAFLIKRFTVKDVYKGKGILLKNETIQLKKKR
jgi:ribosomal protein L6P/L9E